VYTNLIGDRRGGRDIEAARQAAVRVDNRRVTARTLG